MPVVIRRLGILVLLALVSTVALVGCLGGAQNPSYFPYLLPTGDIIRTHAKPPGKGYFADFDPAANRLEVRPEQAFQPIGSQQVFIATIYDAEGKPRRKRRVEWLLEGEGTIIEVDESGYLPGRGYKVDNRYAVSYTNYLERCITRGNDDPADDFTIQPGQTWCVVSSAVPGQTSLTVYAPEIHDWDKHKVVVRTLWVDAICQFPEDSAVRVGSDQILSTRIIRRADNEPLPGYKVRYSIVKGTPATLVPGPLSVKESSTGVFETVSDKAGLATIRLAQTTAAPGEAQLRIEVIREVDGVIVGRADRKIEWQAAQLKMSVTAPPRGSLKDEIPITFSILNSGQVESKPVALRVFVPEGMELIGSLPQVKRDGNRLLWSLPGIPGSQQQLIQTKFRLTKPGMQTLTLAAETSDGMRVDSGATIEVLQARIQISREGPEIGLVGEEIPIRVKVANTGTGVVKDIKVACRYDAGLTHNSQKNPAVSTIASLEPGQVETLGIKLTAREMGKHGVRFTATAANLLTSETDPLTIDVRKSGLKLTTEATPRAYLQQEIAWQIRVKNEGEIPLTNVIVRGEWPTEVVFLRANLDGKAGKNVVQWLLGDLKVGEERVVQAAGKAVQLTANANLRAIVSADPVLGPGTATRPPKLDGTGQITKQADRSVEVLGVPSVQVEVTDQDDPLTVGQRTKYTVRVKNSGSLAADKIEVIATLPPQMRAIRGAGPTEGKNDGPTVRFAVIDSLPPGKQVTYTIDAESTAPGDARFKVEVKGATLANSVRIEEATRILPVSPATPR